MLVEKHEKEGGQAWSGWAGDVDIEMADRVILYRHGDRCLGARKGWPSTALGRMAALGSAAWGFGAVRQWGFSVSPAWAIPMSVLSLSSGESEGNFFFPSLLARDPVKLLVREERRVSSRYSTRHARQRDQLESSRAGVRLDGMAKREKKMLDETEASAAIEPHP